VSRNDKRNIEPPIDAGNAVSWPKWAATKLIFRFSFGPGEHPSSQPRSLERRLWACIDTKGNGWKLRRKNEAQHSPHRAAEHGKYPNSPSEKHD
jgi:hypothetical protein